jgi:ParD-like antitoxin of type II bacterial toxin-antitoxin system
MGMPVKLSEDLVKRARAEARASSRSLTAQIEHWALIGSSVENALGHEDVLALKRGDDVNMAFPEATARQTVLAVLRAATRQRGRSDLGAALRQGRTVYQSDPRNEDAIERIDATGRRTKGRFENGQFVPANPSRTRGR